MDRSVININVGLLGHIDCGKTSLARTLSSKLSTACFDKHPQSQERGITLDLGFSAFLISPPDHLVTIYPSLEQLQVTLVDCPGHASLIKTIISGSQIIDLMLLVIDVTKGLQTQTGECLIIGEITCQQIIVILNKVDLIPEANRPQAILKMSRRIKKTLEKTKFSSAPIIPISATKGIDKENHHNWGIDELIKTIRGEIRSIERDPKGPFMFAIDHCFSIKGQGTIMTGTVIQGSVKVNETIEIASLKTQKKVKSIQMFKESIDEAIQGDRIGICVTQFDSKSLERGIASSPGYLESCYMLIVNIERIAYFKGTIESKSKFHITIFHETTLARIELFSSTNKSPENEKSFNLNCEYLSLNKLDDETNYSHDDDEPNSPIENKSIYGLIYLERPVIASIGSLVIASKLDTSINMNTCRLAFHGKVLHKVTDKDFADSWLPSLKIYKIKSKKGTIERIPNEYEAIANIFKKETNLNIFQGFKVTLSTGEIGYIDGSFGLKGKVKIRIPEGIKDKSLISKIGKKGKNNTDNQIIVTITFKRYIHDKEKKVVQL